MLGQLYRQSANLLRHRNQAKRQPSKGQTVLHFLQFSAHALGAPNTADPLNCSAGAMTLILPNRAHVVYRIKAHFKLRRKSNLLRHKSG